MQKYPLITCCCLLLAPDTGVMLTVGAGGGWENDGAEGGKECLFFAED